MYACLLEPGTKRYPNLSLTLGLRPNIPRDHRASKSSTYTPPQKWYDASILKRNPETNNLNQAHLTKLDVKEDLRTHIKLNQIN